MAVDSREPIGQRVRRAWEAAVQYNVAFHQRIEFELAFALKLRHYLNDTYQTLDQRYVKFRGRELASKIRREVADICAAPIYIEALPTSEDPERAYTAEDAKWALENDIRDPLKGFDTFLERTVLGGISARTWWLAADYDPGKRQIYFRNVDPTKSFICPPYQDVWDPRNPWWIEEVQMRLDDVQAMRAQGWKQTDLVRADNPPPTRYQAGTADSDEQGRIFRDSGAPPGVNGDPQGVVTILKCWYKSDPDRKTKFVPKPETAKALPREDQHLACLNCGYTESLPYPSEGARAIDPQDVEGAPCPTCGRPMKAITHTMVEDEVVAFPDGRLVICAPYCDDLELYDGEWPYVSERGLVPAMQFKCYEHPRDPIGLSETTMDQHVQIVSNALYRRAFDSIMAAPNVVVMPGSAIKDSRGQAFQFTDEPWQIAYYDDPGGLQGQGIKHFQANPVPPGVFQFAAMIQQNFRADIGTAEISSGIGAQDVKDVPVGTVKAFVESGSIPTDHKIRRLRRELSIFFAAIHDMQRSCYTTARWVRIRGADGQMVAQRMRGASLPSVDITVTAQPEFKAMSTEEIHTLELWASFGFSDAVGEILHVPPSLARKIKAEQAEKQQLKRQQMGAQPAVGPAAGTPMPATAGSAAGMPAPGGTGAATPGVSPLLLAALAQRMRGGIAGPANGPVANGVG